MPHPRLDELSDFLSVSQALDSADEGEACTIERRTRIAAHAAKCPRCQASLRFLKTVNAASGVPEAGSALPEHLLQRVLHARSAGTRVLLPTSESAPPRPRRRWILAGAAALLLAVVGIGLATRGDDIEAGTTSGTLQMTPQAPMPGARIAVRYRPAAVLAGREWLTLRARLRSATGEAYDAGIPTETLARLRRGSDGTYAAVVSLPDTIVYAALAVEDSAGEIIDDNDGRAWELLVAGPDGRPLFAALEQRAQDMMGRNWEEGFATVQRMVALYPSDMNAWSWLHSEQRWLGRAEDDSVRRLHAAQVTRFDAQLRRAPHPASADMGLLAWYAADVDPSVGAYWKARVMREAPDNSFVVQWRLFALLDTLRVTHDSAGVLARLDTLWNLAPRDRREQVAEYALRVSLRSLSGPADSARASRWAERQIASSRNRLDAERYVAGSFGEVPALRQAGEARMRQALMALDSLVPAERGLSETLAAQRLRHSAAQRAMFAALGRALALDGQTRAALDTLGRAAAAGWDPGTFQAVRVASLAAGDAAMARRMTAFLAVDPRTDTAFADSARRALPVSLLDSARAEFIHRVMDGAATRSLRGNVTVDDALGRPHALRALVDGHVTVVAFWSPFCAPALADLPHLQAVADRLMRDGVHVVSLVDEPHPTPPLLAVLEAKGIRLPTYYDASHTASRAFNHWATPNYYVLDASGRIRFDVSTSANEVLARAEALRLSETAP